MEGGHHCVERAMHHNCPVCFEVIQEAFVLDKNEEEHTTFYISGMSASILVCSFYLIQ